MSSSNVIPYSGKLWLGFSNFLDGVNGEQSFFEVSALAGTNVDEVFEYIRTSNSS